VFLTVGRGVRQFLGTIGTASRLTVESARALRDYRTWGPNFSQQAKQLGVDSLPIGMLIAGFTGVVLALLASYSFTGAVPRYLVGTLVQKTVMMELAPVLTGLALAGRVGASIAAEIGTMRVTEQIDAMTTLSTDPFRFLIAPRVLAATLTLPILVLVADIIGVMGGYLVAVNSLDFNGATYLRNTFEFMEPQDVILGLVKAAVFGFIIAAVGSYQGYHSNGGALGVGRAATNAVVGAIVLILAVNYLITAFFVE
jgi:phospholipid/cholesterol/gamma-HCH transport system permease protein